jgi:hypothetical protein
MSTSRLPQEVALLPHLCEQHCEEGPGDPLVELEDLGLREALGVELGAVGDPPGLQKSTGM